MKENIESTGKIPEGTKRIDKEIIYGKDAIYCSLNIKELEIPNSVEQIQAGALGLCSDLKKLKIPTRFCFHKYYDCSAQLSKFISFFERNIVLDELVIYGDETELDLSEIDWSSCFGYHMQKLDPIIRIENELTYLKLGNSFGKRQPLIYINNYVENVEIDVDEKIWSRDLFIFRAPQPSLCKLEDCAVELTLAPRETFRYDTRWSCPIKINVAAITYLCSKEMTSFESDKYLGTRLLLLGDRIGDISLQNLNIETYPFVIVWEDEETVYSKLKEKGWTGK